MDLSLANTESFLEFHNFLESFDRNIKVTTGALELAGTLGPKSATSAGGNLIRLPVGDEPWGGDLRWRSLDSVVKGSKRFVAQMGLMQVFSAFEDFLINSKAEHDRFRSVLYSEQSDRGVADPVEDIGLRRLCRAVGLDLSKLESVLPLYDYFVAMRNCVAHRTGRASNELVAKGSSEELQVAFEKWPSREGTKLPELPEVTYGKTIPLFPRHSILAGMVCRSVAKLVNDHQISLFGESGVVLMAAHHSLLAKDPMIVAHQKNAEAVVNYVLCGRYRVRMDKEQETNRILKKIGLSMSCREQYKIFYGKPQY